MGRMFTGLMDALLQGLKYSAERVVLIGQKSPLIIRQALLPALTSVYSSRTLLPHEGTLSPKAFEMQSSGQGSHA